MKRTAPGNDTTGSNETMRTPSLPSLYFDDMRSANIPRPSSSSPSSELTGPTLRDLPPELVHACLAEYADWGDLAKLACVRSGWRDAVADAATHGGRDATWELSMCLLRGNDGAEAGVSREGGNNNKGLAKNEALAVRYLTRLSGVGGALDDEPSASERPPEGHAVASILPGDARLDDSSDTNSPPADEAALLELAECHLRGTGVPLPDPARAVRCLREAYHRAGSLVAAHELALVYERPERSGGTISVDVVAAFEWLSVAAEGGHVPSMAELALCYELGCGTARSDEMALEWYTRAANAGHSASHYSVGEHFEEARGVRMDHEEACLWYWRAAVLGEEDGAAGLRRLEDVARRVVPEADGILNA